MALLYGFHLGDETDADTFSNVIHALIGDGVSRSESQLNASVNGFDVSIGTGWAIAGGRWLCNDAPYNLELRIPNNNRDRIDAITICVNYAKRTVAFDVLTGVDYDAIRENPSLLHTDDEYRMLLYFIRVRRGASALTPEDITDMRNFIIPLSDVSAGAIQAYDYFKTEIDVAINRFYVFGNQLIQQGEDKIESLRNLMSAVGAAPAIGEVVLSYVHPSPQNQWLKCNGRIIPTGYRQLHKMLNGRLPYIENGYIYGGVLEGDLLVTEDFDAIVIGGVRLIV